MIFLISSTNAGLHEEGGDEGGNDRQEEVAELLGVGNSEEFHKDLIIYL